MKRPGIQDLIAAAKSGMFELVLTESLDRLSRDQEDIAGLYKRLTAWQINIITLSEGEVSELHIGLKGTMNALFLKDLAAKSLRGQLGKARAGLAAGGIPYGYKAVKELGPDGELIRGKRQIIAEHAVVVRRIFEEFAAGRSAVAIAKGLNADGIPSPRGGTWNPSTIHGHRGRGVGILHNPLYIGRQVFNRHAFVRDPDTSKRRARMKDRAEWVEASVPELAIIDEGLWRRVHGRLASIPARPLGQSRRDATYFERPEQASHNEEFELYGIWWRVSGIFSDDEEKRIVEALVSFREMYSKGLSDKLLASALGAAEESGLSAVAVLACLEGILKKQKSLPALAHFVEAFDAMAEPAKRLNQVVLISRHRFQDCSTKLRKAFSTEVIATLRTEIPVFPGADELAEAWERVLMTPFGNFSELADTETAIPKMIKGIETAQPWPIAILYCMWITNSIPADYEDNVWDHIQGANDEHSEDGTETIYTPTEWRNAIEGIQKSGVVHGLENFWLWQYFSDIFIKPDKENVLAMWEREKFGNK